MSIQGEVLPAFFLPLILHAPTRNQGAPPTLVEPCAAAPARDRSPESLRSHDEAGGGRPERAERSAAVASAAVTAWEGEELVAEDLVVLAVRPTAKARRRGSAAGQRAGPRRGQQEGRHCVGGWAAIASWGYGGGG